MRFGTALFLTVVLAVCCCSKERPVTLEFRFAETKAAEGLTEMTLSGSTENFYLHEEVLLSNVDIDTAYVSSRDNRPVVDLIFTDRGGSKFSRITRDNVGRHMGMVVDGELLTAPVIRAQIQNGRAVITGDFTRGKAERIARGLLYDRQKGSASESSSEAAG